MKGAKKLKKFIDDELIPTHMQRPPRLLFVILVKENPALPHNMQKSFMSTTVSVEALPAPLGGCSGAIPGKGLLENNNIVKQLYVNLKGELRKG